MTRRSDVLPEPFGPRIATNEGASKVRSRSLQTRRPWYSSVASAKRTAAVDTISAAMRQRPLELGELGALPVLVALEARRDRLGHAHDRDPLLDGKIVDRLGSRRGHLAVVHEDPDPLLRDQVALR